MPTVRKFDHLCVLSVDPGGQRVELGLGVDGIGGKLSATPKALNETIAGLLQAGHEIERAGASVRAGYEPGNFFVVDADQLGVAMMPDGLACLVVRFGALELAVRTRPEDIRGALERLPKT